MALEIEAKMKVADLEAVRARLAELHADRRSAVLEINNFFDTSDSSLLAADQGLRVRQARPISGDGGVKATITFKGPRRRGPLKSREEIELVVDRADVAEELIQRLGLSRVLSFEKRRESWMLQDCHVELDELPMLGSFVEVEGPSDEAVMRVRELLKLNAHPIVKASYTALLMTHLQEKGDTRRVVAFGKK
jgi:adenylate cyclase, class 2